MARNSKKRWTVLIYAAGNSELGPEMWKSKIDTEKACIYDDIYVIMQIGREAEEVVKILRPLYKGSGEVEKWTGVRCYQLLSPESILLKDLGNINMADPNNLYNFIKWGMTSYPANRYMLILAGHGFSMVGIMSDYSQDYPYMMGMPQVCKVLNRVVKDINKNIDILVLDSCGMNSIEILFELGKEREHTVRSLLTYIGDGPLSGMPYQQIVDCLGKYGRTDDLNTLLTNIIDQMEFDLVAAAVSHRQLKEIKKNASSFAYSFLKELEVNKEYMDIPFQFTSPLYAEYQWYNSGKKLDKSLQSVVVHKKTVSGNLGYPIEIRTKKMDINNGDISYLALMYHSLAFTNNNYWRYFLTSTNLNERYILDQFRITVPMKAMIMHTEALTKIIQSINPHLSSQETIEIIQSLYDKKSWDYKKISQQVQKQSQSMIKLK